MPDAPCLSPTSSPAPSPRTSPATSPTATASCSPTPSATRCAAATFGTALRRDAAKAALPEWATFHDLRHFYASLLIARGCSVKTVQKRLGHHSATETLDTYSHLWPDRDDATRAAVDSVLGRLAI